MQFSQLVFNNSPWWVLLAIIIGLLYAFILYSKKGPWGPKLANLLFALRTIVVTMIIILIINPMVKTILNTTVPPKAIIVVDNSISITESLSDEEINEAIVQIKNVVNTLSSKGYNVVVRDLNDENAIDSIKYNSTSTNLDGVLKEIETTYDQGDLSLCVLATDGIYNLGTSPDFKNYSFPIYTLGMGDTIAKKDIVLKNIKYNKVVTQGNKFPIQFEVLQNGFDNTVTSVSLSLNGKEIDRKAINFNSGLSLQTGEFLVDTDVSGLNRFVISTTVQPEEQVSSNNRKDIYIDIIDNKDKILLIGSSPHPDVKALRQAIEKNQNYEFINYIPGITELKQDDYGVAIVHNPFSNNRETDQFIQQLIQAKTPIWYILGTQTNLSTFNRSNNLIEIEQVRGQKDNVSPVFNNSFSKFKLAETEIEDLDDFPPIQVPYGNYQFKNTGEMLLAQRIGSIESQKPLLIVSNEIETKEAVLLGSGIWQWRIQEIVKHEEAKTFDTWVSKLIQYLNTKEDRKKFRINTDKVEYNDSEVILFEAEAYNNIYEEIYDIPVEITITNELGESIKYDFVTNESNSSYKVRGLQPGAYTYTAVATVNGKKESKIGGFSVVELQIETVKLKADFDLLRRLSRQTGASFSLLNSPQKPFDQLNAQGYLFTEESTFPMLYWRWILFLIVGLVSIEWFTRKYTGGY